jgi:hypothetical protein
LTFSVWIAGSLKRKLKQNLCFRIPVQAQKRHAVLAINLQGGSGFEVWQYKGRDPQPIKEEIRLGDTAYWGEK